MRKWNWLFALVTLAFAGAARADLNRMSSVDDRKFVEEATSGGMAEVKLGKLAVERAQSAEVKAFGRRMIADHSRADQELKSLASHKNMSVPTGIDTAAMAEYEKLARLSGADFDRAYMKLMVDDHDHDVKAFRREADGAVDPDLKSWASKTLPTLEQHQRMAHEIFDDMK